MLGWLELALDNAPALVVTGFEDGRVPESVLGDAYLPNKLRQNLGIVDNQKRLARDLYATELLLHSREKVAFITGRRSAAGDPQVPSRIIFHCPESDVVQRVKRFLRGSDNATTQTSSAIEAGQGYSLPRHDHDIPFDSISVTAFARYLKSPYLFYLEYMARLRTLDDRARELDPMSFGSLAHNVLQRFGENEEARNERDETRIAQYLTEELDRLGTERYGQHPLPAVRLQLAQLAYRLRTFAGIQAKQREAGWEIRKTEWSPAGGYVEFLVDDIPLRLKGKIDRIDYNINTNQWAIWDYKTGEEIDKPVNTHRLTNGEWKDLQLPLYCLLAAELLDDDKPPQVGYIAIPRDESEIRFAPIKSWSRKKGSEETFSEGVESAIETAQNIVRSIRHSGNFFTSEGFQPRDPIFAAIGGVGIITAGEEDE
jgi:ATP-dependent helicase/nuclease subunit B